MSVSKFPSYHSSGVQRAIRINGLESARLQQRLGCIEQEKTHQSRLTSQDIRIISTSMVYIQSSSGHTYEAKHSESDVGGDSHLLQTSPCFMYGERIWNRKRKRLQRPMSAYRSSANAWNSHYVELDYVTAQERQIRDEKRPLSVAGFRDNVNLESRDSTPAVCELDLDFDIRAGWRPNDRLTPRQTWEDDISEVTKRILNAQSRAKSGKRQSLCHSHREVMNSHVSRNVRGLLRKIKLSAVSAL